jgi:hypothetical protein
MVFLSRPRCANLDVIFVEHALDDRVGRSPEPALGVRFGSAQGEAQQRRTANLDPIDADGDNCARADVGAAPQPAAAAESAAVLNSECCMGFACQAAPIAAAVASRSWLTLSVIEPTNGTFSACAARTSSASSVASGSRRRCANSSGPRRKA